MPYTCINIFVFICDTCVFKKKYIGIIKIPPYLITNVKKKKDEHSCFDKKLTTFESFK